MQKSHKQSYLQGAAILAAASIIVKIVSAVYKLPIFNMLDDAGAGYFQVTYNVYSLLLMISSVGIPVALSRLVSAARATGQTRLTKRYFSVALPTFTLIGVFFMLIMLFFAEELAGFMNNSLAAPGIKVLAPAVVFVCIIAIYRGYAQGFENMTPTAVSQVIEVVSKTVFGIAIAWWLLDAGAEMQFVSAGAQSGVTVGLGLAIPMLVIFRRRLNRDMPADTHEDALPRRLTVLAQLFKVSIPITLGASFMALMTLIDSSVVLGRLQNSLGLSELAASAQFGIYSKGLSVFNVPSALIAPIAVSIIPAIAAALATDRKRDAAGIMQSSVKLVNLLAMPAAVGVMTLSRPIFNVLFYDPARSEATMNTAAAVLAVLGVASFFVCLQLITTAILQANGHEKITMLTFPVGGLLQVALDYFLVGNPNIGIIGSPFGTLTCYTVISLLNVFFIITRVKDRPKFGAVFIKPLLCTAFMGVAAYSVHELLMRAGSDVLGTGRIASAAYLAGAIAVSVIVYGVLIIATRTITYDDLMLIPKGEKLAKLLKIKNKG